MVVGAGLLAAGAGMLATATGITSYMAVWILFGLAAPTALSHAATTAVQQMFAKGSRRAIGMLTIITAFTQRFAALEPMFGWRGCCLGIAVLHLCGAIPLNAWGAPGRAPGRGEAKPPKQGKATGTPGSSSWR